MFCAAIFPPTRAIPVPTIYNYMKKYRERGGVRSLEYTIIQGDFWSEILSNQF